MSNTTENRISPAKYLVRGGFAGILNTIVSHPLDTVKVKLQTMPVPRPGQPPMYTGSLDCLHKIVKKEGIKGLFKGMGAPLAGAIPGFGINFFNFGLGKSLIHTDVTKPFTLPELYFAGSFTGFFTAIIRTPLERVKCLLQVQSSTSPLYKGSLDCFSKLYAQGGIRSIYRGLIITILREVPAAGMFYMSYEAIKEVIVPKNANYAELMIGTITAGGCSGIGYWILALPTDVLKTRLQTAPEGTYPYGTRDVIKELLLKEGPSAFYTGFTATVLRAIPANAATFTGFELGGKIVDWVSES